MAARAFPWLSLALLLAPAGCRSKPSVDDSGPAESASAARAGPTPLPVPSSQIQGALNPGAEKPYSGPIGGVKGIVRALGDAPPELPAVLAQIPKKKCDEARAFYGKLFREGPARELGDVLVAVTGYRGYLPPPAGAKTVKAQGCAYESRTIALVYGQALDVKNLGGETFIPHLVGAGQAAFVVAMPGGEPVRLFPTHVGQYMLRDQTHEFASAEVFVLKFPTFAVTGIDGSFEITGIPPGEVVVSALLPATKQTASRSVTVLAGQTMVVDFTIPYDKTKNPLALGQSAAGAVSVPAAASSASR